MAPPSSSSPQITTAPPPTTTPPLRPLFLTLLVACPLLILLPPRKLDLYTFSLCGAWVVSAEELSLGSARLKARSQPQPQPQNPAIPHTHTSDPHPHPQPQSDPDSDSSEAGVSALLRKLWMGSETSGWQQRRLAREREELESGKSYGDIIMGQVWEVFPGFGGGRGRDEEEEDEGGDVGDTDGDRNTEERGKEGG